MCPAVTSCERSDTAGRRTDRADSKTSVPPSPAMTWVKGVEECAPASGTFSKENTDE